MKKKYQCDVGLSDHTMSLTAPVAAVVLGAQVIEKHLTFSKKMYGSDAQHSLEPDEFKKMCLMIKETEIMLKSIVNKEDISSFSEMKKTFEKSLVAKTFLKKGTILTANHIAFKKPGTGIKPINIDKLIGKELIVEVKEDHFFDWADFR